MTVKYNRRIQDSVRRGAVKGVFEATEDVKNEVFRLISDTPKTGRIYGSHQASAPGEPFANDTFNAISNIETRYSNNGLEGFIRADFPYAAALEFGSSKMEARPFLRRALNENEDYIRLVITDAVEASLNAQQAKENTKAGPRT